MKLKWLTLATKYQKEADLRFVISIVLLILFLYISSGCTINLQIDTDYASQNNSDGEIQEKVTTESTASNTPTVDTSLEVPEGL